MVEAKVYATYFEEVYTRPATFVGYFVACCEADAQKQAAAVESADLDYDVNPNGIECKEIQCLNDIIHNPDVTAVLVHKELHSLIK
jgi:hypothetical protein